MTEGSTSFDRFDWRLPLFAAIGALALFLPVVTFGFDVFEILYIFIVVPIICLILLVVAIVIACFKRRLLSLAVLSMLAAYCIVSLGLFKNSLELHTRAKWLLSSKEYKSQVLAQPAITDVELKHFAWDGWGWGGNDTNAYLVFDPSNALSSAAKSHSPVIKIRGTSCGVSQVYRLQSHWYSVVFYTGSDWDACGPVN